MRRRVGIIVVIGLMLAGLIFQNEKAQVKKAYTYHNLIRFHVIANSNEQKDQDVKHLIRDLLVNYLKPELEKAAGYEEARRIVMQNRGQIADIARETLAGAGFSYPVEVQVGTSTFPTRAYGDLVLPAGEYEAVRVVLGDGQGANWWCVLFPPLCFVDISGSDFGMSEINEEVQDAAAKSFRDDSFEKRTDNNSAGIRIRVLDWLRDETGYLARRISPWK